MTVYDLVKQYGAVKLDGVWFHWNNEKQRVEREYEEQPIVRTKLARILRRGPNGQLRNG